VTRIIATTKTLIVNERRELLLLKIGEHTKQPERSYTKDLPGGFVDDGEAEYDGAVREIREETGIDASNEKLNLVWSQTNYYKETDASVTHLFYLLKLNHTPEVTVSWEHESYEWVDIQKAPEELSHRPRFRQVIEYVIQHGLLDAERYSI